MKCLTDVFENNGCADKVQDMLNMLEPYIGNTMDSLCGDYTPDSDKCSTLPPLPKIKNPSKNGTFLINLIEIFDSIQ